MLVVVPVDPPHESLAPPTLTDDPANGLSKADFVTLYRATISDVIAAVDSSGGDLLLNVRDEQTLPEEARDSIADPRGAVRSLAEQRLGTDADIRIEPQVGSTRSARIGNTVTHLLEREEVNSVGVLDPMAALVGRPQIDGVAMSLRRNEIVLGPAQAGQVYLAAFTDPIDFTDVFDASRSPIEVLSSRGVGADLGVGFAPRVPLASDAQGLGTTIAEVRALESAGRAIPQATTAVIEELGLEAGADGTLR